MELIIGALIGIVGGGASIFLLQNSINQAKEKFLKLKEEHEDAVKERERRVQSNEDKFKAREKTLSQKMEEVTRKEKELEKTHSDLEHKIASVDVKNQELEKIQQKRVAELSKISGMSPDEAKNIIMEALKDEARTEAMVHINY